MSRSTRRRLAAAAAAVGLCTVLPLKGRGSATASARFHFLSLPKGDAILVQGPNGENALVGAGAPGEHPRVLRYLREAGIRKLDYLFVSTWSEQHVGGALPVYRAFPTARVVHNPLYAPTDLGDRFIRTAQAEEQKRRRRVLSPGAGERFVLSFAPPFQATAIAPTGAMLGRYRSDPSCSLVTEFNFDRVSMLDLGQTTRGQQQLMWKTTPQRPEGQILKVGRGGKADALLASLLKPLRTQIAVLHVPTSSASRPSPELLATLRKARVKIYRTDRDGNVIATTDGRKISLTTRR